MIPGYNQKVLRTRAVSLAVLDLKCDALLRKKLHKQPKTSSSLLATHPGGCPETQLHSNSSKTNFKETKGPRVPETDHSVKKKKKKGTIA